MPPAVAYQRRPTSVRIAATPSISRPVASIARGNVRDEPVLASVAPATLLELLELVDPDPELLVPVPSFCSQAIPSPSRSSFAAYPGAPRGMLA